MTREGGGPGRFESLDFQPEGLYLLAELFKLARHLAGIDHRFRRGVRWLLAGACFIMMNTKRERIEETNLTFGKDFGFSLGKQVGNEMYSVYDLPDE